MKKEIENPKYANNADTRIEYDAAYYDSEGKQKRKTRVSVNKGSNEFEKIQKKFGEKKLQENKRQAAIEIESRKRRIEFEKQDRAKKSAQEELFHLKSYLFNTRLIHETASKKLRRKIRKAQTLEETRMLVNILLMEELFGLEADSEKVTRLLTQIDQDE